MDGASNIVTFLGLADIILRAGLKIYDFIATIHDAPQEIRNLQHELNGVTLLLSELKDHWSELSTVQGWSCPTSLMDSCISSLRIIHQDLDILVTSARKHDSPKRIASTWAKVEWALGYKQVVKLTRSLERHKLFLVAALAVDGKRMQHYYQQELKQSILQSSEQILSSIESRSERCDQQIKDLQMLSLSKKTIFELEAPKADHVSTADSGFLPIRKIHRGSTTPRRKFPPRISTHSRKLDALHADVKHLSIMLGRSNASPSPISHAQSFGENREEILLSLLLLQPQIKLAIASLSAEQRPGLSKPQLGWLGSEFSLLFTAVMQDNDAIVTYNRTMPTVVYTDPIYHTSSFYGGRIFSKATSECTAKYRGDVGHKGTVIRIWRFESTGGRLEIRKTMTSSDQIFGRDEDLGFTFMPFLDMPVTAISVNFRKKISRTRSPQIHRQLHTYTVLPYRECRALYKLIETGTLCEIDDAFRHGRTSPYILDFVGRSIHYPAARAGRLDVLKYLSDQGFGPATIDAGSHALRGLCELWRIQAYSPSRKHKRRDDIFRWLVDRGCDVNYSMPLTEGPVQYTVTDSTIFLCGEGVSLFQHWITMLRQEGYDLETRNFAGETALLAHAGIPGAYSIKAIQWLLTSGADTKATNQHGFNSLVCAMLSTGKTCERHRSIIRSKLRCLISGGCDIYQCDFMGLTPSQHAVKSSCWYEWCYALEYNGLNLHEVIAESKALQKLSFLNPSGIGYKHDLPLEDSPSSQVQISRSQNLLAIDSYNKWKRAHIAVFVYFSTSISTMHAVPDSDYRPLLDLCNDSNDSAGFVLTWEDYSAIYENITELFVNRKDLFCVLYALNRTLPNVWDDLEFHRIAKPRHIPRVLDSIDEVIIVLRIAKIFYHRFYMTSQ